jgi:Zn-dependent protease
MSAGDWRSSIVPRVAALGCAGLALAAFRSPFADTDPVEVVMTLVLLIICLGVHEAAHAWVALKCGDPTARDLGRITLNPIPHIDLFMTILLPAMLFVGSGGRMMFGGAKPVPVNFHRLRHPWRDMSLVALAGPVSNMILALFFIAAWKFFMKTGLYNGASPIEVRTNDFLPKVLASAVGFNALLAVFNLVPIPPLDGSRVLAWLLPDGLRASYVGLERFGMIVIFGLLYMSSGFNAQLNGAVNALIRFLESLVPIQVTA